MFRIQNPDPESDSIVHQPASMVEGQLPVGVKCARLLILE